MSDWPRVPGAAHPLDSLPPRRAFLFAGNGTSFGHEETGSLRTPVIAGAACMGASLP